MPATTTPQRPLPSLILLCREVESIGVSTRTPDIYVRLLNAAYVGDFEQVQARLRLRPNIVNKIATRDDIRERRLWDTFLNRAPLHVAIEGFLTENNDERLQIINHLIEKDADVNLLTAVHEWAPIHYAALVGSRPILMLLIEKRADVNVQTREGETALMLAFSSLPQRASPVNSVVEDLVNHGADINAKNSEGQTCLIIATINGQEDRVRYLLRHNSDLTLGDNYQRTALLNAIAYRKIEIARILIAYGADVSAGGNFGKLPSEWAQTVASDQEAPVTQPVAWNNLVDILVSINERRVPLQDTRQRLELLEEE